MTARTLSAAAAFMLAAAGAALAGETTIATGGGSFTLATTSLREARFRTVIRQQHDFSCGSAAIATLLTFHYGRPTSEEEAFRSMYENGDRQAIERQGFSLADMQNFLSTVGLHSDGFRISLDKIAEVGVPAVTLIETKGYSHFVVIKGVVGDEVLVGDPALGLKTIPRAQFEQMWKGVVFVVRDEIDPARETFNRKEEWAVRRTAPFGTALSRQGLATFSIVMPGLFEF